MGHGEIRRCDVKRFPWSENSNAHFIMAHMSALKLRACLILCNCLAIWTLAGTSAHRGRGCEAVFCRLGVDRKSIRITDGWVSF